MLQALQQSLPFLLRPTQFISAANELTRHVVVRERGDVELQHLEVLCDDVGRGSGLLVPQQLVVGLDDVSQLVGDIVLKEKLQCSV